MTLLGKTKQEVGTIVAGAMIVVGAKCSNYMTRRLFLVRVLIKHDRGTAFNRRVRDTLDEQK